MTLCMIQRQVAGLEGPDVAEVQLTPTVFLALGIEKNHGLFCHKTGSESPLRLTRKDLSNAN